MSLLFPQQPLQMSRCRLNSNTNTTWFKVHRGHGDGFDVYWVLSFFDRGTFHPNSPPPKKKTWCIPLSKTPDREQTCKLLHPTCKPADTGSQKPQTFDNELEEATPTPSPTIPAHQHGGSNKDTNSKTRKKHKNKNSHSKRAIHRHPAQRHNHCSHSKQPQMAA